MITYTKDNMKITHPSGVIQTLTIPDLQRLITSQENQITDIIAEKIEVTAHIEKMRKINKPL